jgi:hypothetical protein
MTLTSSERCAGELPLLSSADVLGFDDGFADLGPIDRASQYKLAANRLVPVDRVEAARSGSFEMRLPGCSTGRGLTKVVRSSHPQSSKEQKMRRQ